MATDLVLSTDTRVGSQQVYVKAKWIDAWTLVPGLQASHLSWGTMPVIGQAVIDREFGLGMLPGEAAFSYKAKLAIDHYLVKVVYTPASAAEEPLIWYGVIVLQELQRYDRYNDNGTLRISGKQIWHCFELSYLLTRRPIAKGFYRTTEGFNKEVGESPTFNLGGVGNRSASSLEGVFLFSDKIGVDDDDEHLSEFWDTKEAINYLLKFHSPTLGDETAPVFQIENTDEFMQPAWDKPVVPQHGQDLWGVLSMFLSSERCLGGYLQVDETVSPAAVKLRTFTYSAVNLELGLDSETLPMNPSQFNLVVDFRPDLGTTMKLSSAEQYDRIILEGGMRRVVCTLNPGSSASEYEADWEVANQSIYNTGASSQTGYSGLDDSEKKAANSQTRNSPHLYHVFKRFKIRDDWDGKTGAGVSTDVEDLKPVFVDDDDPTQVFGDWPAGRRLLQSLPLNVGVDYSGSKIADGDLPGIPDVEVPFMPPMVFIPTKTDPNRWVDVTAAGLSELANGTDKLTWSARVRVDDEKARFWVDVVGDHQHMIADAEFSPLPVDDTDPRYDWTDSLATLCFEESRHTKAVYPESVDGGAGLGFLSEKYINVGNTYRADYVVANTVLGIDPDNGDLLRSDGGFVRDDRDVMKAMAKQLFEYFQKPRRVLHCEKDGATKQLWLGDFVVQLGASTDTAELIQEVGTAITSVSISFPASPGPPRQTWDSVHGELDELIVRPRGKKTTSSRSTPSPAAASSGAGKLPSMPSSSYRRR